MNKPYTIIQCSNYFEYITFKDKLQLVGLTCELFDSTYTVKLQKTKQSINLAYLKQHAPTATITQVSFRNGRATYTKLKD